MNPAAPQTDCAIGIDVGGTKCAAGLVMLADGRVTARRLQPTRPERGGAAVIDDVLSLAQSLRGEAHQMGLHPASMGIALCELVGPTGQILSEATVRWRDAEIAERLRNYELPIVVEADVRAAARAEARYGAGRDHRCFLFVTVGTGISGCLVLDRQPFVGARGLTGTFASSGALIPCAGGELCSGPPLESFSAGPALAARYAEQYPEFRGAAREVLQLAADGDTAAEQVVTSGGMALGAAIAGLVNMLDPEVVVIGGGLGLAEGLYRRSIEDSLRRHVWSELHREIRLVSAELGNDAGVVGAALATVGR